MSIRIRLGAPSRPSIKRILLCLSAASLFSATRPRMSNLDTRWLQTASKRSGGNAARRQGTPKRSSDCGVVEFWAAGKDIDGRVGMFGPGVDRDVGFFDDHHAAHA